MRFYEVGGCVRDEILGIKSKDIDFSVVMEHADIDALDAHKQFTPFEYMAFYLEGLGFEIFVLTPEYLTIRAKFPKGHERGNLTADFVLARRESGYSDGRRPDEVEPGSLYDDLKRRDFTMNAIAKDDTGLLLDPFHGAEDIADKIIRAVGDPHERLAEDALRAVRALRFSVTKGFGIERELQDALESDEVIRSIVEDIADERIKDELSKMFRFNSVAALYTLARFPRLTSAIFSGSVSLDATMKLHDPVKKAAKKAQDKANSLPTAHNGCTCRCHSWPNVKHMVACCRPRRED